MGPLGQRQKNDLFALLVIPGLVMNWKIIACNAAMYRRIEALSKRTLVEVRKHKRCLLEPYTHLVTLRLTNTGVTTTERSRRARHSLINGRIKGSDKPQPNPSKYDFVFVGWG